MCPLGKLRYFVLSLYFGIQVSKFSTSVGLWVNAIIYAQFVSLYPSRTSPWRQVISMKSFLQSFHWSKLLSASVTSVFKLNSFVYCNSVIIRSVFDATRGSVHSLLFAPLLLKWCLSLQCWLCRTRWPWWYARSHHAHLIHHSLHYWLGHIHYNDKGDLSDWIHVIQTNMVATWIN